MQKLSAGYLDHEPARCFWQINYFTLFPFNSCTCMLPVASSSGSLRGVCTQSWRGWLLASSHSRLCAHSNNWAQFGRGGCYISGVCRDKENARCSPVHIQRALIKHILIPLWMFKQYEHSLSLGPLSRPVLAETVFLDTSGVFLQFGWTDSFMCQDFETVTMEVNRICLDLLKSLKTRMFL